MKKITTLVIASVLSIGMYYNSVYGESSKNGLDLALANVEAIAQPEVSFDFCMVTKDLCTIYDDGLAIRGYLQYSGTV